MKNVRKQYHSNKNYTYCRLIGQGYSLLTVLNQLQSSVTPPKGVHYVTLSSRTLSTIRSLCYPVSSRTLSTIRSLCYPVSSLTLSTSCSPCYPVSCLPCPRLIPSQQRYSVKTKFPVIPVSLGLHVTLQYTERLHEMLIMTANKNKTFSCSNV